MRVAVRPLKGTPARIPAPALCVFVHPAGRRYAVDGLGSTGSERVDKAVREEVSGAGTPHGRARLGRVAAINTMGLVPARRIILAWTGGGRGDPAAGAPAGNAIRHAAGAAARSARDAGCGALAVVAPSAEHTAQPAAQSAAQVVEGVWLSLYRFDRYKSGAARGRQGSLTVVVRDPEAARSPEMGRAVGQARAGASGAVVSRDIGNMPPNECPPAELARAARSLCSPAPLLRCRALSGAALERGGFGGIRAVGGGSRNAPRLIVVEYRGGGAGRSPGRALRSPVAIVGKAVTFDTGGISLKPRDRMDEMKFDKCGGCAVLGIMHAAAAMRLPVDAVGIIPSAENMPGGGSYRPGDIVRLYGGRTAEILNTDAEGRLLLADAIAYAASEYAPREIVDLATLTGACVVALGANTAGLFSNDDALAGRILAASARTGEGVWRLPLDADHTEMIRSRVADVKNMGTGRAAGAAAAAAFLRAAAGPTPWAHIDIAGTAWTQTGTAKRPYNPGGATGFGVRLILDLLAAASPAGGAGAHQ